MVNGEWEKIDKFYGVYLTADDIIGYADNARHNGVKSVVDIAVRYQDRVIEFDLVDFLTRLGFMDEK